jgi:hypothetical protein
MYRYYVFGIFPPSSASANSRSLKGRPQRARTFCLAQNRMNSGRGILHQEVAFNQ